MRSTMYDNELLCEKLIQDVQNKKYSGLVNTPLLSIGECFKNNFPSTFFYSKITGINYYLGTYGG